jgi:hypothetical protein
MFQRTESPEDRFRRRLASAARVNECWLWNGYLDKDGYGTFAVTHKHTKKAHRYSYELNVGPIPQGLCVCHRCDTPSCVRPGHLFVGTMTDNDADRDSKGRQAKGESSGTSRFTNEQIRDMRNLRAQGLTQQAIAELFNTAQPVVSRIVLMKAWKHI